MINIRRAAVGDEKAILCLLEQVLLVHHCIKPDLFLDHGSKYTEDDLRKMFEDDTNPIFVAVDDTGKMLGHCFTQIKHLESPNLITQNTLFIDDLCIDENARGQHVGKAMYEYACEYARLHDCRRVTLHVWEGNDSAIKFYEAMGMKAYQYSMEAQVL